MNKKNIPWWKTVLGQEEIEVVRKSILNRNITQGIITKDFENQLAGLLGVPYLVLVNSGSSALLAALIACGIGPGDEVIIPGFTFIATVQAPLILGAKVRLVDVKPNRPVIDENSIEAAVNSKTKAIIPVHLNGRAANLEKINKIAKKYKLSVIEDAVQALCSKYKGEFLGTQSDIGVFSLGVTKFITAVQGGFLVTRKKDIFNKLQKIKNHGCLSLEGGVLKCETLGFNFKFNDLFAGIGLKQLEKVKDKIKSFQNIYSFYKKELVSVSYMDLVEVKQGAGELPLWIEVISKKREKVLRLLKQKKVEAKPFHKSIGEISYIKNRKKLKYSQFYAKKGLILPSGPDQKNKDLKYVIEAIKEIEKDI
jgi:dTDP-4-amino-4,6-dideoxygalactose transaminase